MTSEQREFWMSIRDIERVFEFAPGSYARIRLTDDVTVVRGPSYPTENAAWDGDVGADLPKEAGTYTVRVKNVAGGEPSTLTATITVTEPLTPNESATMSDAAILGVNDKAIQADLL